MTTYPYIYKVVLVMDDQGLEAHGGLVVIERVQWGSGIVFVAGERALSAGDVTRTYKGIDGRLWPDADAISAELGGEERLLEDAFAPISTLHVIRDYYHGISRRTRCDLLYCVMLEEWARLRAPRNLPDFDFYGYDYGYCVGAYANFSAILNDVIYGGYPSLNSHASKLNGYLLLPTVEAVQALHASRVRLIEEGGYLEKDEQFLPIAVYGYMR